MFVEVEVKVSHVYQVEVSDELDLASAKILAIDEVSENADEVVSTLTNFNGEVDSYTVTCIREKIDPYVELV